MSHYQASEYLFLNCILDILEVCLHWSSIPYKIIRHMVANIPWIQLYMNMSTMQLLISVTGYRIQVRIPTSFYPRPILAFGYCVCARPSVCANHFLVRVITQAPLQLGSPNLDQRCKTPWLSHVYNSTPIQARITKFGPGGQNVLVKTRIVLRCDWPWFSRSNLTFKSQNFLVHHYRKT